MAVVDANRLGVTSLDDVRVVGRCLNDLRVIRLRSDRLIFLDDEHRVGHIWLAVLRGNRHRYLDVVAGLGRRRCSCRYPAVLVHREAPTINVRRHLVGVAVRVVLHVLRLGLTRLDQLHTEEGTLNLRCRNLFLLGHSRGGVAGLGNLFRLGDLGGLSDGLGTDANDLLGRLLGTLSRHSRVTRRLAVDDLLSRGHNLGTQFTLLVDLLFAGLEGVVEDDLSLEWNRLLNLGHHGGVLSRRAVLDDLLDRVLGLLFLNVHGAFVALGSEVSGVSLLTRNTLLDNLDLTRLQPGVRAGLNRERNLGSPGDLRRRLRRLGADLDNLVNRLFGDFLGDLRVARLGVNNVSLDRHLLLARNTRGHNLRRTGRLVRIELDLHTERNLRRNRLGRRTGGLGTHANYLLGRLLGALSRHSRLTRRLAVDDLLSRGHNLGTQFTLLVDLLFAGLEGVVEDDLSLEWNRLLNLGHHGGVLSRRAVLDDLLDRVLGLLFLNVHGAFVALGSEVSGVSLLTRNTLLDNLDLTRLQPGVRAGLNRERNLGSPGDLRRRLRRLSADLNHLVHRLLGDLLLNGGFAIRLGVGDLLGYGDGLLTRLAFGNSLRGTSRHIRVKLDLYAERNLRLNRLLDFTGGLGTHADLLRRRFLGPLSGHGRVAGRLTVDKLLGRGLYFGSELALLVDDLLASRQRVVEDNLGLERNRLLSLGHQFARSKARAVLDDPLDRLLGGLFLDYLSIITLGGELGGVSLLAVCTFLDDLGLARLQVRVLANLSRVRDRNRPCHVLGALSGLGADDNDLVNRCRGLLPGTVLLLLLLAGLAFSFYLVRASRDGVVVLVLDVERNLTGWNVDNVYDSVSGIGRTVLVSHSNWNLDLVTWLRIRRCGCGDLAIVVNADVPAGRNIAQLVWVFLRDVDVVRLVQSDRQLSGLARVDGLYWVGRLGFPVVGQLHHGGDRRQRGSAFRSRHSNVDGLLVTRLGICRRGGRYDTGARVDLVLPAVDFLFGDRCAVLIGAEGELRTLRGVLDVMVHSLIRASGLHAVRRSDIALQNDDGALDLLRLVGVVVVGKNRNVQDVALGRGPRNGRGDFTSVLVNLDGPRAAVIRVGVLGLTVLEGVARRCLVGRVAAQSALRKLRLESDLGSRLIGHRVVGRDLDIDDRLELGLDLVRGLVRVGRLHLRGDDGARRHGVVRLRGDLARLIDGDGPTFRDSGRVDLELSRVNRLVALHDGLGAHLGGEVITDDALSQTRAHQVSDLRVVRVDNHEQLKPIGRAVRVLDGDHRTGECARLRVLRSGDGDVVVLVHLHGPALVDVLLVEGGYSFKAAFALLLRQFLDQVWDLGEGDLLWLGSNRTGSTIDARNNRSV